MFQRTKPDDIKFAMWRNSRRPIIHFNFMLVKSFFFFKKHLNFIRFNELLISSLEVQRQTKASQTKFRQIQIKWSKVIDLQMPVAKWEKHFGLQSGAIMGLEIGASSRDYKSEQEGVEIGTTLGI